MIIEEPIQPATGWTMLLVSLAVTLLGGLVLIGGGAAESPAIAIPGLLMVPAGIILFRGLFTLQPNQACVLSFFGPYVGTVRQSGFYWVNPFYSGRKISLRARNLEGNQFKVNDKLGNPIEIAAVIVWHVVNTAQACFEVDDYINYVQVQSESAVRHLANSYAYDHGEPTELTLRSGVDEVSAALQMELHQRLDKAGVAVDEARLTHLAYAPEIAGAMLRRQQAEAIIAARQKIVYGAVSMVEMALEELTKREIVVLDDDRRAQLVSSLLVILCGETEAQPVINAGAARQ